jgi:hypothetical protein
MENQAFKFTAFPDGSCALPSAGLVIAIEYSLSSLTVLCPNQAEKTYPLAVNEEPSPKALFLSNGASYKMQVGQVDFYGKPQKVWEFPLNDGEFRIEFKAMPGMDHIGSLDIRDIGRQKKDVFDFSIVPIIVSISGNYLRVTTLEYDADLGLPAWYKTVPTT